jgi:hypothetical protein
MNSFRITSIAEPIAESPEAARYVVASVFRADLMDLLPEWVEGQSELVIDAPFLRDFGACVVGAGIGRGLPLVFEGDAILTAPREELDEAVRSLWQALDDSPYPEGEWSGVRARLEDEQLSDLLQVSTSSIRRYASGQRETPDEIAWRLHTLTRIIAALSGSYNDYGVRRWFERPRAQLDGRSPSELIAEATSEDDPELVGVVDLAESLVGPGVAT